MVFAEIFPEDVREYREAQLEGSELEGRWPLWNRDTAELAEQVQAAGFRSVVVAVDAARRRVGRRVIVRP